MENDNISFEGNEQQEVQQKPEVQQKEEQETTPLNHQDTEEITGKDNKDNDKKEETDKQDNTSTGELEPGTEVEFDGAVYTVAENGDLVDKNGKVFKEAKEIANWLKENEPTKEQDSLSLSAIKEAIGVDITDENGQPVEFTEDAAGVKNYVDSVIALKSKDIQDGAINKLYNDNPLLKQFIDYVQVTGSPRGFGELPDRSGIVLNKDDERQLEIVVRMAAQEFGNKSLNDNYIKYLKESGSLYDEAKAQLDALVEKDKYYRKEIEYKAQLAREEEEQTINAYWQSVKNAIDNRVIGKYKLPDNFVKESNGQKITITPNDFYKYIAEAIVADEDGNQMTAYQRDLNKLSIEERLNADILNAWLMFTGGSYKDLIDMAIKEDKVRRLVIKSKEQRNVRTVKVNKPNQGKVNPEDIVLS